MFTFSSILVCIFFIRSVRVVLFCHMLCCDSVVIVTFARLPLGMCTK